MNFDSLNKITKRFLLNEGNPKVGLVEYVRSLGAMLEIFRPRNRSERTAMNTARQNLKEIKRHIRVLNEEITQLQDKVNLLEESNEKGIVK